MDNKTKIIWNTMSNYVKEVMKEKENFAGSQSQIFIINELVD